jgi:hypothetical protein
MTAAGITGDAALASKLEGVAPPEDGFHAVARLAWGLTLCQYGPESAQGALGVAKGFGFAPFGPLLG